MSKVSEWNKKKFDKKDAFNYYLGNRENSERLLVTEKITSEYFMENKNKDIKILDVGCGDGKICEIFKKIGFCVYGVDVGKNNIEKMKKMKLNGVVANIEEGLPFANNYFDYVFAGEVIEHVLDTKFILKEVNRVLKKGGRFLVTTPNLAHLPERWRLLKGKNPTQVSPVHEFLYLHVRPFTWNMLSYVLELSGFEILRMESTMVVFKWDGDKVIWASSWLSKLIPGFGNTLIVESKKI